MRIPAPDSTFNFSYPGMTVADLRDQCCYSQPPAALELPHFKDDRDGDAMTKLENWFKDQGVDHYDGVVVYLADRFDLDLEEAERLRAEYESNQPMSYN